MHIRSLESADRAQWNEMWAGYLAFYKTELAPSVSDDTWKRIVGPDANLIGLIACDEDGKALGFAHALLHAGTWSPKPVCYLEDLFVRPEARGQGVGRELIESLATRGREEGWVRLYWQTAQDNETAQALYGKLATRTKWVRYDLDL